MADTKISALTSQSSGDTVNADLLVIVDSSLGQTKAISIQDLRWAIGIVRGDADFGLASFPGGLQDVIKTGGTKPGIYSRSVSTPVGTDYFQDADSVFWELTAEF